MQRYKKYSDNSLLRIFNLYYNLFYKVKNIIKMNSKIEQPMKPNQMHFGLRCPETIIPQNKAK